MTLSPEQEAGSSLVAHPGLPPTPNDRFNLTLHADVRGEPVLDGSSPLLDVVLVE